MRKSNRSSSSATRVVGRNFIHAPDPRSDLFFLLGVIATLISVSFKPSTSVMILAPSIAFLAAKVFLTHRTVSKAAIEILVAMLSGSLTLLALYAARGHVFPV